MIKAPPVKKSKVNQSINAAMLRLKVGRAKAASAAKLGSANNRVFSGALVSRLAINVTVNMNKGRIRCWLHICERQCARHRHNVHAAKGHAGHKNHMSNSNFWRHCGASSWIGTRRHCHKST